MVKLCAGSLQLQRQYPQPDDSPASIEGTAAHWVWSEMMLGRWNGSTYAPNGAPVTVEMLDGAQDFMDSLLHIQPNGWKIETPVPCLRIAEDCWGTPDAFHFSALHLHVADYKFGHRFVDEFENWQLVAYALGILEAYNVDGEVEQVIQISFHIGQPRCYGKGSPFRTWTANAADLRALCNVMANRVAEAKRPDALCTVNPYCGDCSARHACSTLQRSAYGAMALSGDRVALELPPAALGVELRMVHDAIKSLEARASGLEEQAAAELRAGKQVPFYGMATSQGREAWTADTPTVAALGDMFGVNLRKDGLVTPNQARTALTKKGVDEAVINGLSSVPVGAMKLVPVSNDQARKAFYK